jgi:hypothetical protein
MAIAHDPAGERETDSPPFFLCRKTGIEDLMPDFARYARTVVRHANPHTTLRKRLGGYLDPAVSPGQCVDRVFRQRLECPLQKNRVSFDDEVALV